MKAAVLLIALVLLSGCAVAPRGFYDDYRPYYTTPPCPPPPPLCGYYGGDCGRHCCKSHYGPPPRGGGPIITAVPGASGDRPATSA